MGDRLVSHQDSSPANLATTTLLLSHLLLQPDHITQPLHAMLASRSRCAPLLLPCPATRPSPSRCPAPCPLSPSPQLLHPG